jgi:phospholipid/cholesterol/gamma-HCH transport system substrate-binding protein
MDERATQFRVGLLVLATFVIAGIMAVRFGEVAGVKRQYTLYIRFRTAPGVTVDTPIMKSGLLIGRVAKVSLLPNNDVVVTAKLDNDRTIRLSEVCKITTGSILGDAMLDFVQGSDPMPSPDVYRDGDYLDGVVANNPLTVMESAQSALQVVANLETDIRQVLVSIQGAGNEVGNAARNLNSVVQNNQEQFQRIVNKAEQAMNRVDNAMAAMNSFVVDNDVPALMGQAIQQVPALLTDAREAMGRLKGVLARTDQNLRNIEKITGPFGEKGPELAEAIERGATQLDTLLKELLTFSKALNSRESTVGQLLHDKELYSKINRTVGHIEEVSKRLRPIVDDVRVISDKVARDPGRIGAKGLLDRTQSGLK